MFVLKLVDTTLDMQFNFPIKNEISPAKALEIIQNNIPYEVIDGGWDVLNEGLTSEEVGMFEIELEDYEICVQHLHFYDVE